MNKTISSEKIYEKIDKARSEAHTIFWNDIEIKVKPYIEIEEMTSLVDYVARACFAGENNEYTPEFKVYAYRCAIIDAFTNIELPASVEERYRMILQSEDLFELILAEINDIQYSMIYHAIKEKVDLMKQANISAVEKAINELANGFEELENNFSNVFSGISQEEITNFINSFSGGNIDEGKIMDAYLSRKGIPENEVIPFNTEETE